MVQRLVPPDYYETLSKEAVAKSEGPEDSYDPAEPGLQSACSGRIISVYRSILYKIYVGNKGVKVNI